MSEWRKNRSNRRYRQLTLLKIISALFKLLQSLALELTEGDSENDLKAKHAELILKCIWKRSRTTKEDIIKGVINEEDIFTILEEFLQVISPKEWRLRAARKVPLGDMPLRTVKVLIQHAVGKELTIFLFIFLHDDANHFILQTRSGGTGSWIAYMASMVNLCNKPL